MTSQTSKLSRKNQKRPNDENTGSEFLSNSNKKQKLNPKFLEDVIPNDQNSNFQDDYFDFQDVFCNDWFLIELGKNLVTNPDADKDLLNILCLNRKINSRATTVFKNYFLNFELQKQVQTLANAKQFDHVEQLFETQKLALNPNFNITLENKNQIPKESFPTFTFENSEEGQEEEEQTNENQSSQFPFVTFALRSKSHSLVKSLLLHPRMNFARLSKPRLFEIIRWVIESQFPQILVQIAKANLLKSLDPLQSKVINLLMARHATFGYNTHLSTFHDSYSSSMFKNNLVLEYLFSIAKLGASKQSTLIHNFFLGDDNPPGEFAFKVNGDVLKLGLSRGFEETSIFIKYLFEYGLYTFSELTQQETKTAMKFLLEKKNKSENEQDEKEVARTALKFSFGLGLESKFKFFLNEREWSQEELLELFKIFPANSTREDIIKCNYVGVLKLLLNKLDKNTSVLTKEVSHLFEYWLEYNYIEEFKTVWNDQHFVRDQQLFHEHLIHHMSLENDEFVDFLFEQYPLSAPVDYDIRHGKINQESHSIRSEFRNCFFLNSLTWGNLEFDALTWLEKKLEIKWTNQLFEWSCEALDGVSEFEWLLQKFPSTEKWWNEDTLQLVLMNVCTLPQDDKKLFFDSLLKHFPQINLGLNFNEALRSLLSSREFKSKRGDAEAIVQEFEKQTLFLDSEERQEFSQDFEDKKISERILKMKSFED